VALARAELRYRVEEKRVELLHARQEQERARGGRLDPGLARELEQARQRMRAYEVAWRDAGGAAEEAQPGLVALNKLSMSRTRTRAGADAKERAA
jgi:hypothetical protein